MYDEQSFLEGLVSGLTATAAPRLGPSYRANLLDIPNFIRIPSGEFETFVSKVTLRAPYPATLLYEYGPDEEHLTREFRRVSGETTVYHVHQPPEAVPLSRYLYQVTLLERSENLIRYQALFVPLPFGSYQYPGTPEAVDRWLTGTSY